ncbi:MAG: ribosome biogenesis GTP-binding protein YihA/YsxC [Prevotellaceae bacterium]|nr:ribosome biogenesis GTP-binding protein YihA/YsxC [Prevotellaceae bacterium]
MIIRSAEFISSSPSVGQCPGSSLPEYAFIGRSNVGKSSLINALVNRKKLAHTSSTPGKTQLINHYLINAQWYLVDLPGYGYARSSKTKRDRFAGSIAGYIMQRAQLSLLFVLLDSRLAPQQIDLDFITRLGEWGIPFALVFTKIDKLKTTDLRRNREEYEKRLLTTWEELPPVFVTSAETGAGRDALLAFIEETNRAL